MSFFLQLRLLMWKNFTVRKRQKVRCVVELIWPLFLFLLLMWVRTRGLKEYIHECHFEKRALPSAGEVPFLQSFFCTLNNTCFPKIVDTRFSPRASSDGSLQGFQVDNFTNLTQQAEVMKSFMKTVEELTNVLRTTSTVGQQLKDLPTVSDFLQNKEQVVQDIQKKKINVSQSVLNSVLSSKINIDRVTPEVFSILAYEPKEVICNKTSLSQLIVFPKPGDIDTFMQELCTMSDDALLSAFSEIQDDLRGLNLLSDVVDYAEKSNVASLSWSRWLLLYRLTRQLVGDVVKMDVYFNALDEIEEVRGLATLMRLRNVPRPLSLVAIAEKLVCGTSNFNAWVDPTELSRRATNSPFFSKEVTFKYVSDPDVSEVCNELFERLESNLMTRLLWLPLKPLVRGKILFAPETESTGRIMEHVNKTFDMIAHTKQYLEMWSMHTRMVITRQIVNSTENIQYAKDFIDSRLGQRMVEKVIQENILGDFFALNISRKTVINNLKRLLDKDDTTSWLELLDEFQVSLKNITAYLDCFETNKVRGFATEEEALNEGLERMSESKMWAVVIFQELPEGSTALPPYVKYKIRMNPELVESSRYILDRIHGPGPRGDSTVDLKYFTSGFLYLQDLMDRFIIMEHTGESNAVGLFLQQFPYPCYINDRFVLAIARTFPLLMTLSWVYSCAMIVKSIVYEKEQRLKETMRVMGLSNGVHWIGWFVDSLGPVLITILILTAILVWGKVLEHSDPSIVFVFLLLYCIATITKSFLISTIFSRANLAAAAGGIIFFILYLPYPFIIIWESNTSAVLKASSSLISNVAFGFGCSYFASYEEIGAGLQWANFAESPVLDDPLSLKFIMLMLIFDAILYFMLTWYIEAVFPGLYGVPKPWYFPVTKSYWCGTSVKVDSSDSLPEDESGRLNPDKFESDPKLLTLGVRICELKKVYSNGKVAVCGLSMNFYQDQITSFLGHNGAGKTTTISILTGLVRPTSGTAKIYGLDIRTAMDSIRNSLGVCPQHNVLFDKLTVDEHLWFYARLKGRPKDQVLPEVEKMLVDLQLPHKRSALACELSGGMQRKLSIAAAFIGGSRTVILDEPTSGVDPYSRRSIWELLIKYKQGRTVILTTHFMDEADLLGDRIAIIANGNLQCCGSSLFLKSQFGTGYYLSIDKQRVTSHNPTLTGSNSHMENTEASPPDNADTEELTGSTKKITQFIQENIPSAMLVRHLGHELQYVIPYQSSENGLETLFKNLEANKSALGINSYGISDTTLEEIFIKVAEAAESDITPSASTERLQVQPDGKEEGDTSRGSKATTNKLTAYVNVPMIVPPTDEHNFISFETRKAGSSRWQQFSALQFKMFHRSRRNVKALISELILPALFIALTMAFTTVLPDLSSPRALVLEPWIYGPPNHVFYEVVDSENAWSKKYEAALVGPVGMGTRCVIDDGERSQFCKPVSVGSRLNSATGHVTLTSPECSCSRGTAECPPGAGGPPPALATVSTGDVVLNMTRRNISDWLVKTESQYSNSRYGGFSFGVNNPLQNMQVGDVLPSPFPLIRNGTASPLQRQGFADRDKQNESYNVKIWFNNRGWHSAPSYVNAISNIALRASLSPEKQADHYGIQVTNHPMNFSKQQMGEELRLQSAVSLLHAIAVIFALSFVPASFVVFLVDERVSNAKHLQLVSGVNKMVYWIGAFCWHFVNYVAVILLCIFVFLAFNEQAYVSPTNLPGLVLLLLLYGWACIPLMYPASFVFSVPSSAFVGLACTNMFVGIVSTIAVSILELFEDDELQYIGSILKEVFLVLPHFCLGRGLMQLATHHVAMETFKKYGMEQEVNIFDWDYIGKSLVCLLLEGIVFFLITLAIEYRIHNYCWRSQETLVTMPTEDEEEDVAEERSRVNSGAADSDVLVLKNLTKIYHNGPAAVNQLCIGIKRGECFGLLGLNGAGKTTTFKMLTGHIEPTAGDAFVSGQSLSKEMNKVHQLLGYCPQFDALDSLLTVREHLQLYSQLRGVPSSSQFKIVDDSIKRLGLGHYANRLAGTLSGGNKRKLSTAIALIGDPPLVFLDEPTTGMDPQARRFLWSCIIDVVQEGRSVVLTSHSMEECEALCTRLTIMVNGTLRCLGSTQRLKSKFGHGYSLTVRCKSSDDDSRDMTTLVDLVTSSIPGATLTETHHNQAQFHLSQDQLDLSKVFQVMERAREQKLLEHYSMSQTTLEEVFLKFANEQKAEGRPVKPMSMLAARCFACCRCRSTTTE